MLTRAMLGDPLAAHEPLLLLCHIKGAAQESTTATSPSTAMLIQITLGR